MPKEDDDEKRSVKKKTLGSGGGVQGSKRISLSESECVQQIFELINESAGFKPTFVAWCIDQTPSAKEFRTAAIVELKTQFEQAISKNGANLSMAVYGFGKSTTQLGDGPITNSDQLVSALDKITSEDGNSENAFSAITTAVEQNATAAEGGSMFVIVISDEAPSDLVKLENTIKLLSEKKVTTYVIGKPAPFGRAKVQTKMMGETQITFGPETAGPERVETEYWGDSSDLEWLDSGFGPWGYERLCRQTGGQFLAVRPSVAGGFISNFDKSWPLSAKQFSPADMSRLTPDYRPYAEYKSDIDANAALKALQKAAGMPKVTFFKLANPRIQSGDEARMQNEITRIQQLLAAGTEPVRQLYETLKTGEGDREKITNTRWQISFDLAMARATANYVRLDSANQMLGKAKSGMKFEDEKNNTWLLEPSFQTNSGGVHKRMAESATSRLQQIVEEHPGTPWALIAERELASPMGWQWTDTMQ